MEQWIANAARGKTAFPRTKSFSEAYARRLFDSSGWILQALPSKSDRELLSRRLAYWLTDVRRGRLWLPDHFPEVVRRLSNMTKSQVRASIFWVKPDYGTNYFLEKKLVSFVHQVLPGGHIRTVNTSSRVHAMQSEKVKPLPTSDWPRLETRSAWPSSPTIAELLEMSRRGITSLPLRTKCIPAKDRITLAQFNSLADLRARLINRQIVGIRSDILVPGKFLGYFEYRWGFLILKVRYNLPTGLVRFLTGQWIRNPHNLWLREKYSFKTFLKKTGQSSFGCTVPGPW